MTPADVGGDFDIDFVGFQFGDGFAGGDRLAFFFQPAQDGGFGDGLSHLRDTDFNGHGRVRSFSILRRSGALGFSGLR